MSYLKAVKKLTPMGMPHWNAIKDWTKTEEGMAWLCMAQIDPLGVQLDHVVAQNGTASGYDSVFNCYFMPPAPNSWFGEYDTKEKRDYMGKQAVEISKRFTKWMKAKVVSAGSVALGVCEASQRHKCDDGEPHSGCPL